MDKQQFRETFSQVHTPEATVREVLNMSSQKKYANHSHRVLRLALIAAIVLVMIAGSVLAADQIRKKMGTQDIGGAYLETDGQGNSQQVQPHEVYFEAIIHEDAPDAVTEFYLPQLPEGYTQYHGYLYKDNMIVQYGWKLPEAPGQGFFFSQEAGGVYQLEEAIDIIHTKPGMQPEAGVATIAGIDGYLVRNEPVGNLSGSRIFYWSDGKYVFRLEVPYEYTEQQLAEMVASVQLVEDIRPSLIGMTEKEKDTALKRAG